MTINAGATLNIVSLGPYQGVISDTFTVLTGSSVTGTFDTVNQPANFRLTPTYTASDLDLDVTALANIWDLDLTVSWQTGGNWSRGVVPDATHFAVIDDAGITVTYGAESPTTTISELELSAGSNLTISAGSLTVTNNSMLDGSLTISGGTLSGGVI